MWYERLSVVIIANVIVLSLIGLLSFSVLGCTTWQLYMILIFAVLLTVYNAAISHYKAIDMTVDSLAKHYEKQMMEEIQKAVKKAMGM